MFLPLSGLLGTQYQRSLVETLELVCRKETESQTFYFTKLQTSLRYVKP